MNVGPTLANLAQLEVNLGLLDSAREHLEQAVALSRDQGNQYNLSFALGRLGELYRLTDRPQEARRFIAEATEVFGGSGHAQQDELCLSALAMLDLEAGNLDSALALAKAAVDQAETNHVNLVSASLALASVHAERREVSEAREVLARIPELPPAGAARAIQAAVTALVAAASGDRRAWEIATEQANADPRLAGPRTEVARVLSRARAMLECSPGPADP